MITILLIERLHHLPSRQKAHVQMLERMTIIQFGPPTSKKPLRHSSMLSRPHPYPPPSSRQQNDNTYTNASIIIKLILHLCNHKPHFLHSQTLVIQPCVKASKASFMWSQRYLPSSWKQENLGQRPVGVYIHHVSQKGGGNGWGLRETGEGRRARREEGGGREQHTLIIFVPTSLNPNPSILSPSTPAQFNLALTFKLASSIKLCHFKSHYPHLNPNGVCS